MCVCPRTRLKFGERCFAFAGPAAWNSLPSSVQELTDTTAFKHQLKTVLFQVNLGYPVFSEAKDDGGGGDNWNYMSCKLQSNHHTNKLTSSFFTGRMSFLSPNQQRQSTEGKLSHNTGMYYL